MPELPEVETIRRALDATLVGRRVQGIQLLRPDILRARHKNSLRSDRDLERALLQGSRIVSIRRHGKALALMGDLGTCLQIHLGMSGQLRTDIDPSSATHVHAVWDFDGQTRLCFRDPRRFGGLWPLATVADLDAHWARLGPDAFATSSSVLQRHLSTQLATTRRAIKAALLDQSIVAGIGNIYADESLFEARLDPRRPASTLDGKDVARLTSAVQSVLRRAIKAGGSTLADYRSLGGEVGRAQAEHRAYGRAGMPCTACGTSMAGFVAGGRTTAACLNCQR